jgi:hypothetical protein
MIMMRNFISNTKSVGEPAVFAGAKEDVEVALN